MSVSRFGSHPPSLSPSLSMEQVKELELENQQLKVEIVRLKAQLAACHSSTPVPVVLALDARRTVDSGSSHSSTTGLSPSQRVMPVAKADGVSSTTRHSQSASTSSSVVLSSSNLLELSTPVPGPDKGGDRGKLLQLMRDEFQASKLGKGNMVILHKVCLKLHQCMALTLGPFTLRELLKVNDCASAASVVSAGGPHCWAEEGKLKKKCEGCLSAVSVLEKEWGRQTSGGGFFSRRRTSSTSLASN